MSLEWDLEVYASECSRRGIWGGLQRKELDLERSFPGVAPGIRLIRKPTTVVDAVGRIVCWILPGLFPKRLQVNIYPFFLHSIDLFRMNF